MAFFDRNGTEIKAGMTLEFCYTDQDGIELGSAEPLVEVNGIIGFYPNYFNDEFIPLKSLDLSNTKVVYIPPELR